MFYAPILFCEINHYLFKVKNSSRGRGKLSWNVYIFNSPYKICFLFVYQKYLKPAFKTFFWHKMTFHLMCVLWIHKGCFVIKKMLLNVGKISFWYTNYIKWYQFLNKLCVIIINNFCTLYLKQDSLELPRSMTVTFKAVSLWTII